jgi:hypothetical protein
MNLIYRRLRRSPGSGAPVASRFYYAAMTLAFASLAIVAIIRGDWLVACLAMIMPIVTVGGAYVLRTRIGQPASDHALDSEDS